MLEKHCDPTSFEIRLYQEWMKSGCFEAGLRPSANPYTIMIPPPNVTGTLHIGHALNNTLQDVLIRIQRMRGDDCLWQAGMDHAGIATQMVVERELAKKGKKRTDMSRSDFIDHVWQWKQQSGGKIEQQLHRLGASADWENSRFTMDEGLSHAVLKAFVTLYRDNLIYRDMRLVNWDPHFETAISDLEVQQVEVLGKLWHIRYPIEGEKDNYITIATTRPETMLGGDVAIAVHPEDERWQSFIGKSCALPFVGKKIMIIADNFVDREQGSGAVKISPGHDFNDFDLAHRHDLELVSIFDTKARITSPAPEDWHGMDRFAARDKLVALFEQEGLLEKTEEITHTVPHGDRSNVPVEPFLTKQWFVDAKKLAGPALKAVEDGSIRFVPKQWVRTYKSWMENIQPWCISRQLWWGHQLPVWYGPDGEIFVAMDEQEALEQSLAHYGKKTSLKRDPDVLDTWFSSALWPFSTLGWPEKNDELARRFPTDILVTAFDIIFFWVARMIMFSLYFIKQPPFKIVYVHALVRDEKGQKMSKSKGNVIDPIEIIDSFGCDALRFTLASLASPGRNIRLSKQRIEGNRKFVTKIWNIARFATTHHCQLSQGFDPKAAELTLNRWIASQIATLVADYERHIEQYRFDEAVNQLYHFIWGVFCDWYLEFAKTALHGDDKAACHETRHMIAWCLSHLLRLLHPFMPFVTSEIHAKTALGWFDADEPLMLTPWPDTAFLAGLLDDQACDDMSWVMRLISHIRSLRIVLKIEPARKIPIQISTQSMASIEKAKKYGNEIKALARLSDIEIKDKADKGISFVYDEVQIVLLLGDTINIIEEQKRIRADIEKLEVQMNGLKARLDNPDFCKKAPQDIISAQREKLDDLTKQCKNLEEIQQSLHIQQGSHI